MLNLVEPKTLVPNFVGFNEVCIYFHGPNACAYVRCNACGPVKHTQVALRAIACVRRSSKGARCAFDCVRRSPRRV